MSSHPFDPSLYKQDAQGRYVPIESIKEIDIQRDTLVADLVKRAQSLSSSLRRFRDAASNDIQSHVEISAERYDVKLGGRKGNVTLMSYDGRYKIERAISDVLVFDEGLQIAKTLVDECLHEWGKDANTEIRTLIMDAFQVDTKGRLNTKRILSLRQYKFDHPKWQRAMQAIHDAIKVADSRAYIRFYERTTDGKYQPINLDLANANYVPKAGEEVQG